MKETKSFAKLTWRALLAMVCFLGAQALLGLAYEILLLGIFGNLPGVLLKSVYTMGTLLITWVAAFPLFCAVMRVKCKDLRALFQRQKNGMAVRDAGGYLLLSLGVAALPILMQGFLLVRGRLDASALSVSTGMELVLSTMQFVVVMPVLEEMMFRGVMLKHFRPCGAVAAVAASTLLFAFGHLNPANILVSLPIGFVLGCAAVRAGNIRVPLLVHMIVNLLGNVVAPNVLGCGSLLAVYLVLAFSLVIVLAAVVLVIAKRGRLFSLPNNALC